MLETFVWSPEQNLHGHLRQQLEEIFYFPEISPLDQHLDRDMGLDVVVPVFHTGGSASFDSIPLFWRPRVSLCARLYYLKTGEILRVFKVTEKAKWNEYLTRTFEWRQMFGFSETFRKQDMEILVSRGSVRLLQEIAKVAHRYA